MNLFKDLKKPENLWLLIIMAVAAVLRFYHYGAFSYSNDELSALNRLHYDTFSDLVQQGFYVDGHPGGVQIFLWKWVKWFGDTEWAVRLPFVLAGILAVWMGNKVALFMFGTSAGLFTAAALAFLQFPLLYSQIARPYGPGMLFSILLAYFWLRIFFTGNGKLNSEKPTLLHLAGFTLSAALCMYTHYFSFLFALIAGFSGFVFARRNNIFQYIGAALMAALLFVPHIPITLNHLTYKGVGFWLGVPGKTWIFEHLFYIFDQSLFFLTLFLVTLITLIFVNRDKASGIRYRILMAAWFLAPFIIAYVYSHKVSPVLQHPVLIFSFPFFIMLIFSYAGDEFSKKKAWILAVFLSLGVISTAFTNSYYTKQHFGEFRNIARLTAQWQKQYGDSSITKTISINNPLYIDYYLSRYSAKARFEMYDIYGTDGLKKLSDVVRNSNSPYFLYAITKPTPSEGEDIIRSTFPYIADMQTYGTLSSVVLFGREKGMSYENANKLTLVKTLSAPLNKDSISEIASGTSEIVHHMDSVSEYSPGIELLLDELIAGKPCFLQAETDLFTPGNSGGSALVISIETPDGKSLQWKGALAEYIENPGKWCHLINTLRLETTYPKGTKLKVYFWNKDKKTLYLKDLKCIIFQ